MSESNESLIVPIDDGISNLPASATLPDLVLLVLFDHLPLLDMFNSVPLVCKQWHRLQPEALAKRHRLHLLQPLPPDNDKGKRWLRPLAEGVLMANDQNQNNINSNKTFILVDPFTSEVDWCLQDPEQDEDEKKDHYYYEQFNSLPLSPRSSRHLTTRLWPKLSSITELSVAYVASLTPRRSSSDSANIRSGNIFERTTTELEPMIRLLSSVTELIEHWTNTTGQGQGSGGLRVLRVMLNLRQSPSQLNSFQSFCLEPYECDRLQGLIQRYCTELHTLQLSLAGLEGNGIFGVGGLCGVSVSRLILPPPPPIEGSQQQGHDHDHKLRLLVVSDALGHPELSLYKEGRNQHQPQNQPQHHPLLQIIHTRPMQVLEDHIYERHNRLNDGLHQALALMPATSLSCSTSRVPASICERLRFGLTALQLTFNSSIPSVWEVLSSLATGLLALRRLCLSGVRLEPFQPSNDHQPQLQTPPVLVTVRWFRLTLTLHDNAHQHLANLRLTQSFPQIECLWLRGWSRLLPNCPLSPSPPPPSPSNPYLSIGCCLFQQPLVDSLVLSDRLRTVLIDQQPHRFTRAFSDDPFCYQQGALQAAAV